MATENLSAVSIEHGKLAEGDMPRDLVGSVNEQLLLVVTLLRAARDQFAKLGDVGDSDSDSDCDSDCMTDGESRTIALYGMADEKVRSIINAISPYV